MTVRTPVLSVTYGAFSLTLEGFEDPFATMRDVAEYFRTVLAEDRSFGARPAAPRAEGLRRFAEGRVGRSVHTAQVGERVHLRAGSTAQLRAVPVGEALLDEDAETEGAGTAPEASAPVAELAPSPAAAPIADEADPLSAAFDEAPAGTLPTEDSAGMESARETPRTALGGRRSTLPAGADEAAVERLISQADSALAGADAQRRHATFAHLKAAVAATRADADAGDGRRSRGPAAAEIARYRDVLAQSVGAGDDKPSPRRASRPEPARDATEEEPAPKVVPAGTMRSGAPDPSGPGAPLILVAEQRVAGNGGGDRVTPRRIDPAALGIDLLFDEGAAEPESANPGFERFLERTAPAGLSELIDAAAAYLTHVEGMQDFPRQHVMRLIAGSTDGQPREDLMRCFGILLREGKLRRSRRGQLESGERSAFTEAARRFRSETYR